MFLKEYLTSVAWNSILKCLEEGTSLMIRAPRYFGKRILMEMTRRHVVESEMEKLTLAATCHRTTGEVNYQELWRATKRQLDGKRSRRKVDDRLAYVDSFCRHVKADSKLVVFVENRGGVSVSQHYEVLAALQAIVTETGIIIVAEDDYSLWYHSIWQDEMGSSTLKSFVPVSIPLVPKSTFLKFAREEVPKKVSREREDLSALFEWAGGHPGLVDIVLDASSGENGSFEGRDGPLEPELRERVGNSFIMDGLRNALAEDPIGLSQTALDFREASYPSDLHSARIQKLRELGIVYWYTEKSARLLPGVISGLIEEVAGAAVRENVLGNLVSDLGPRVFVQGALPVSEEDFLVVHIADLHIGEEFPFRPIGSRVPSDPSLPSLGGLLRSDLTKLGLLGRVDALVVSGDFVETGSMSEFRMARDILREIQDAVEIESERMLIVAGNHDVEWSSGGLVAGGGLGEKNLDNYLTFRELIGVGTGGGGDRISLSKRCGRRLNIVGLDSNFVESPEGRGVGFIPRESLEATEGWLRGIEERDEGHSINWIVTHHHVFAATSVRAGQALKRQVSLLANAAEVLGLCARMGVEVILHGHEHQPAVTAARRWPVEESGFRPIITVGVGSLSGKREVLGPFGRNHYFIVQRQRESLVIRSRKMGDAGLAFVTHSDLLVPGLVAGGNAVDEEDG